MAAYAWGRVIERFDFDMDGRVVEAIKYHPWRSKDGRVFTGDPDTERVEFHCEEMHESFFSLDALLIAWIARKNLGMNQSALVAGICRALAVQ